MSLPATIERIGELQVVNIGIEGFDYSKVAENAEAAALCATPIGKKYELADHFCNEEYTFVVPFTHFFGIDGNPETTNHDKIRTFSPQVVLEGRKIVSGVVQIDYLGTNPKKQPMVGIQRILNGLSSPLQDRWDDVDFEEEFAELSYSWDEIACTVEELPSGLSVLRFNFHGKSLYNLGEKDVIYDIDTFTSAALSESGIK